MAQIAVYRVERQFRRRATYESAAGWVTDWVMDIPLRDTTAVLFDIGDILVFHQFASHHHAKAYHHRSSGKILMDTTQAPDKQQLSFMETSGLIRRLA